MHFLLSHCNTENTRMFGLSVFDTDSLQVSWLDLSACEGLEDPASGFTGLCTDDRGMIYAAIQSPNKGKIAVFEADMRFKRLLRLHRPCDIHAICHYQEHIYYAATRYSEVRKLCLQSGEDSLVWSHPEYIHLNDIKAINDRLYILSQNSPDKDAGGGGSLFTTDCTTPLISGLNQPHTILQHCNGSSLYVLDSRNGKVINFQLANKASTEQYQLDGYARGMAICGEQLLVGLSADRIFSRKQGMEKLYMAEGADYYANNKYLCRLALINNDSKTVKLFDYSQYNFEIYDIIRLSSSPRTLLPGDSAGLKAQYYRKRLFEQAKNISGINNQEKQTPKAPATSAINRLKKLLRP